MLSEENERGLRVAGTAHPCLPLSCTDKGFKHRQLQHGGSTQTRFLLNPCVRMYLTYMGNAQGNHNTLPHPPPPPPHLVVSLLYFRLALPVLSRPVN